MSTVAVGTVEAVVLVAEAAGKGRRVERARALPMRGLEGDRYGLRQGTYSDTPATGRDLTLIAAEAIEAAALPDGSHLTFEESRRNVVTRGVDLDELIGRRFRIGEVECYGQRRCEPCDHLEKLSRPGVLRAFVHRGGLRADILRGGELSVGDRITVL